MERVRIELDSIKANTAAQHQPTLEYIHEMVNDNHNKGNKGKSLANPSETSVDKLTEGVNRADFISWVSELYMHLDGMPGWMGTTA